MKASVLLKRMGRSLVGKRVITEPMGNYPGGIAVVTKVRPDPEAPEVVFNVFNEGWTDGDGGQEIGVFNYEEVALLEE